MKTEPKSIRSKICALCVLLVMSFSIGIKAQVNLIVTGDVTDETGTPLIGVSVTEKGSLQGAVTDIDGKYSIKVTPSSVLTFSYLGYKAQDIAVDNRQTINVVLEEDSEQLDEVVVIGYGVQKKKDLTGSVGSVNQSKMENQATTGIGQNLQGKLAGVQIIQDGGGPNGGTSIRIRGIGSFGASSSPLIVIDGMITNDGLGSLNPDDVENITVLKDAASAAIYGSRGANGVVIITTKKGSYESPVKVNFSAYGSIDQIRHKMETLTAKEYAIVANEWASNGNFPQIYTQHEIDNFGKGTNWLDEITQNGYKQSYSLSITGGSQMNSYAATMNFYVGDGMIKNTDYKRGNVKLVNEMRILPTLKLGVSMNANYGVSHNGDWNQSIERAMIYPSTVPVRDENGNYGVSVRAGEPTTMVNPLIPVDLWTYDGVFKKFLGHVYADWEIIKGLTVKSTFYAEYTNWNQDAFIPSYSYGPKDMICDHPVASLDVNHNESINYEWDNIATYNKTFNRDHNLTVMAGVTFQKTENTSLGGSRTEFLSNDKHLQVLSSGQSKINNWGNKSMWSILSYLSRINYDYQGKYLLSASLRVDKTSRIIKENRTGVFPGASAGWVLSKESFLRDVDFLSYLKVRASWGILGNQEIGIYPYQTSLNSSSLNYPFGAGNDNPAYTGVGPTTMGNSQLKWEKTTTYGVGIESNFFNDRLRFIADFYKRNTKDILVQVPLLSTSGMEGSPYQNAGKCENTGIELSLSYGNSIDNVPFTYEVSVNWTYNKNKVTYIPNPIVGAFSQTTPGHSINEWYGYVFDGIFQNEEEIANSPLQPNAAPGDMKFKDLDGDNKITTADRKFLGHAVAPHVFGANITLGYNNFDFVAAFYGQVGGKNSIDAPGFALLRSGETTSAWMFRDRWTGEGSTNERPRVVGGDPNDNYRRSSFWLRSTDFLRLQNVQLGYNFGPMLQKTSAQFLKKLRVYVAAQNLFCINSYPGFDPEIWMTGFPIPRSFYAGVNVGF